MMPNLLKDETAPYLLQHKDNPVNWYPWSDEAFLKAKNAIQKVAKEKGYSYVFDTSVGALLYWPEDSDDLLPLVKKELGL